MATFAPSGSLYLIGGTPLDNTYENTIDHANASAQQEYFMGKVKNTCLGYTYIRKDSVIKIPFNIEVLFGIDYVMYQNYDGAKWIYAFITKKTYSSGGMTICSIETDVMQTYAFDYVMNDSFIEREHQDRWKMEGSDIKPVYNQMEENLALGDDYVLKDWSVIKTSTKWYLVVTTSPLENASGVRGTPKVIQGYPTPFYYYLVPTSSTDQGVGINDLCVVLSQSPYVVSVSLIPFLAQDPPDSYTTAVNWTDASSAVHAIRRITSAIPCTFVLGTVDKLLGILGGLGGNLKTSTARDPKFESKLLTYPYAFNKLQDFMSPPMILKNEYLFTDTVEISCSQSISHQVKTKYFISSGYRGETNGKNYNMINTTVNDIPLTTDAYLNYMLTNKASMVTGVGLDVVKGAVAVGVGVATGGVGLALGAGVLTSSASAIGGILGKTKDLQNTPDSVRSNGNNLCFDVAEGNTNLQFQKFGVNDQIYQMLGDYFALYGYKCNEVKMPNMQSRYYYNYIKTVGANITGDIEMEHLDKIKAIFNNGLTFWHNRTGTVKVNRIYDDVEMSMLT